MSQPKYICRGEEIAPGTAIETENLETYIVERVDFNMVYAFDASGDGFITKTKAQFRKWFRENGCTVLPPSES